MSELSCICLDDRHQLPLNCHLVVVWILNVLARFGAIVWCGRIFRNEAQLEKVRTPWASP